MGAARLPANPSLVQAQKQAKDLLRQHRSGDPAAQARFQAVNPRGAVPDPATLADAQFVIARENGFETWTHLKRHIDALRPPGLKQYQRLARILAEAYMRGDRTVIREVNWTYGTAFVWDHDPVDMQRRLPTWFADERRTPELALEDAQRMVAHSYGFESWAEFAASLTRPPEDPRSAPLFISLTPPYYTIDWSENRLSVRGPQTEKDWDRLFDVMREHGIARLSAGGISDRALKRLARLDHVTHLEIEGGQGLTDEGVSHLSRMTRLEDLTVGGPKSPITSRGLAFLRHLRALRRFQCCWAPGVTDEGLESLSACDQLESVNLMGTASGDGAIAALAGKRRLSSLQTGRGVTDDGLRMLHDLPVFKSWQGGEVGYSLMSADARPNHLMIDGPFTDEGLACLAGLDGLFGLSFFWHCPSFTAAGLAVLRQLPRLGFLGCQGERCDDEAMRQIAAIPNLRMLMGQGTVATDEGFVALGRSESIEYLWGRECPNLTGRGFAGLAAMPSLRGIAVSLRNVDDAALSTLPAFPALRELMPMDASDAGFRHVGRCEKLEALWCMYCRDTGDAATEHLAGLSRLKHYYAGNTRITDDSLEILSRFSSLERLEFWACNGLTDAGVSRLAGLPRLKELHLGGLQGVSRGVLDHFKERVAVKYWG
jgi:hypothetical protein